MIPKLYNSFEEIDTQLNILKLQRAIEKEQLIYNYHKAKRMLYPQNITKEISNSIQHKLVNILLNKFAWVF